MDKKIIVVYSYNGIIPNNTNEQTIDICNKMD